MSAGRAARQALGVIANRGLMSLCNFVTFVLLARLLTSEEFGIYGVFTSGLFLVETAGNLGLRQASAHQIGQGHLTDAEAFGSSLMLWPVSGTLSGLLVWWSMAGTVPAGEWWHWLVPSLIGAFAVVLTALGQGVFLGRGQIGYFSLIEVLPRILLLAGVVVMAFLGLVSVEEQSWLFALSFACAALVALILARLDNGARWTWDMRPLVQLVRVGWPFALTVFLTLFNARIGMFILTHKVDAAAAGHFFAAARFGDILLQGAASVGLVLFSHGARSSDPRGAIGQAAQVSRLMIWATLPITIAGLAVTPVIVPVLLGQSFSPSVPVVLALLFALPFATFSKILAPTLSALGRSLLTASVLAPAILLNAALSYWLTGPMGVAGAGLALAVSQVFIAAGLVVLAARVFGRSPGEFLLPRRSDVTAIATAIRQRLLRNRKSGNSE